MRLIVAESVPAFNHAGADAIHAAVRAMPDARVVLPTGNTPLGIYAELSARSARSEFDATKLRVFQLDEYLGLDTNDSRTLFGWMDRVFLQPMRVPLTQVVRLPSDTEDHRSTCAAYDQTIDAAGGLDLVVLGLGPNGHIGFNEPGSHAHSPTRALLLSEESLNSNASYWGGRDRVPLAAMTCGMKQLLAARQVILLVSGEKKREILRRALKGPIGPAVPASYLQLVNDLVVVADRAAAAGLHETAGESRGDNDAVAAPAVVRTLRSSLMIGVDAGNSKTVAVVATDKGKILGYGRAGGGDMYGVTPEGAMMSVDTAIKAALSMAGVDNAIAGGAGFSMAGADWPEDYQLLSNLLAARLHADKFTVVNDSVGATRAGTAAGWGIGVALGTWATSSGRARKGRWQRAYWMPNGGGGGLANAALDAVYAAEAGVGQQTVLSEKALSFFGIDSARELLHQFTKREDPKPQGVHRFAPHVLDAAAGGDAVAAGIVLFQGRELGKMALALARKLGIERQAFPLVLTGGVFRHHSQLLADSLINTVRAEAPRIRVHQSDLQPVAGAAMLAMDITGRPVDARVRGRLQKSMPDDSFFAT